jgi:uncharacterized paraquat-inducible protein A
MNSKLTLTHKKALKLTSATLLAALIGAIALNYAPDSSLYEGTHL